uniref:Uncharacterized protein n=1 Tax=Mastacembelus armatus TaxID=205130 RepID=A0A7N8XWS9_9TELE
MPPPAPLLYVLLCVSVALQRSDLRLAYVTHNSFSYYSCSQDPQPCSVSSLTDCRCKDIQLSTLHRPQSHSSPVFRMRRLTVWFTSPLNVARLLNNSQVRHLTLIHCGTSSWAGRWEPRITSRPDWELSTALYWSGDQWSKPTQSRHISTVTVSCPSLTSICQNYQRHLSYMSALCTDTSLAFECRPVSILTLCLICFPLPRNKRLHQNRKDNELI